LDLRVGLRPQRINGLIDSKSHFLVVQAYRFFTRFCDDFMQEGCRFLKQTLNHQLNAWLAQSKNCPVVLIAPSLPDILTHHRTIPMPFR
jgi:hypothetical protein